MIGQRIRERRLHKKLTQKQLASLAKIRGSISELENSKYLPSAETLLNISQILDCSIEWILTGEDRISDNAIPEQLSDILPLLKQLSPQKSIFPAKNSGRNIFHAGCSSIKRLYCKLRYSQYFLIVL